MASKKKSKKSVVPHKLQIPLAILLGIVFIFVLNSRLKGRRTAQGASAPATQDEVVTADVAVSDSGRWVDALIDKITNEEPKREHVTLPDLAADPFVKPDRRPKKFLHSGSEHAQRPQENDTYAGQSREQFLESLTLQATLIDGHERFALINDTLYGESDTIGAFKIVRIGERAASLKDNCGRVILKMKGDDLL